jgi:hypothetical protein
VGIPSILPNFGAPLFADFDNLICCKNKQHSESSQGCSARCFRMMLNNIIQWQCKATTDTYHFQILRLYLALLVKTYAVHEYLPCCSVGHKAGIFKK